MKTHNEWEARRRLALWRLLLQVGSLLGLVGLWLIGVLPDKVMGFEMAIWTIATLASM